MLKISFDDGMCREIDFQPTLKGELYGPLRDLSLFEKVVLDSEVYTLVWPNGADFDPSTLHNWPSQNEKVESALEHWQQPSEAAARS